MRNEKYRKSLETLFRLEKWMEHWFIISFLIVLLVWELKRCYVASELILVIEDVPMNDKTWLSTPWFISQISNIFYKQEFLIRQEYTYLRQCPNISRDKYISNRNCLLTYIDKWKLKIYHRQLCTLVLSYMIICFCFHIRNSTH